MRPSPSFSPVLLSLRRPWAGVCSGCCRCDSTSVREWSCPLIRICPEPLLPDLGDTGRWSFKGLLLLRGTQRDLLAFLALENGSVGVAGTLAREWAQVSNSRICCWPGPHSSKPASRGCGVTWAPPPPNTGLILPSEPPGSLRPLGFWWGVYGRIPCPPLS